MKKINDQRVAFFLPSLRGGGAERVTVTLANEFTRKGIDVDVVLGRADGPGILELDPGIRLIDLNARRVLTSLPGLVRYFRRENPRVVISGMMHSNIVAILAKRFSGSAAKLIVREDSVPSLCLPQESILVRAVMRYLMVTLYPQAKIIVTPSYGVARDLNRHFGLSSDRIKVIYNPVIYPGFEEKAKMLLSHPWFASGAPPVILSVGRLGPEKDFACLVRAFSKVRARCLVRLMILGEGSERPNLERMIQELGVAEDVALPGFVDNPMPYMSRASVYALSSRTESLGNALIEAMATGCPVVATDCPFGPREILVDGAFGWLVPTGDDDAMSRALLEALRTPRVAYPTEVLGRFSAHRIVDEYQALIR